MTTPKGSPSQRTWAEHCTCSKGLGPGFCLAVVSDNRGLASAIYWVCNARPVPSGTAVVEQGQVATPSTGRMYVHHPLPLLQLVLKEEKDRRQLHWRGDKEDFQSASHLASLHHPARADPPLHPSPGGGEESGPGRQQCCPCSPPSPGCTGLWWAPAESSAPWLAGGRRVEEPLQEIELQRT